MSPTISRRQSISRLIVVPVIPKVQRELPIKFVLPNAFTFQQLISYNYLKSTYHMLPAQFGVGCTYGRHGSRFPTGVKMYYYLTRTVASGL